MKFAIIYYSKTGHTREMAEVIARGLAAAGGETRFFSVEEAMDADYIVIHGVITEGIKAG